MVGLVNSAAQQEQQPASQPRGSGLTPEKEEMVAEGYRLGRNILYRKDVFAEFMNSLEDMSPDAAMAEAIVFIVQKINEQMKAPFDVLLGIGLALLADLAEALNRTGRVQITQEDVPKALEMAITMYLNAHGREFDENELRQTYEEGMQMVGGMQ